MAILNKAHDSWVDAKPKAIIGTNFKGTSLELVNVGQSEGRIKMIAVTNERLLFLIMNYITFQPI
jgi:hypothetical protein